ncbi:TPA: hypothetical protein R1156_004471 [Yersinia enterocolitica]|nr:hypothetical protein [Yersinia enterocolitica]
MTAEIAVYNKTAVALAADSAVTISGGGKHKIYNGAEKLFSLSKHHPVGLMVYGSGDLCTAPWELVIKAYRAKISNNSFDTLENYAEDFFKFLENGNEIISDGMRDEYQFSFLNESVFSPMLEAFSKDKQPEYWTGLDPKQYAIDLEVFCHDLLRYLSEAEFLDGFSGDDIDEAIAYCNELTPIIVENFFDSEKWAEAITPNLLTVINEIFATMICKKSDLGNTSGIVIAGYGNKDFYPKVISYDVCGFFKRKLRKSLNLEKCTSSGESGVTPFAQDDEVSAFMQGCSGQIIDKLHEQYTQSIESFLEGIDEVISSEIDQERHDFFREKIVKAAEKALSKTDEKIQMFIHENYVRKVVDMVKFLPKQDLAYMAESLVNLTAFKRKVSEDSETVGGPIDVAIISKTDGFIWVRRKHYFDKELNHHFFARA